MNMETTAATKTASLNGNGTRAINGKVAVMHPFQVQTAPLSLMAKLESASSEKIELSKGTVFLIGLIPVFLGLILSYGSSFIGWAREDQSKSEQLKMLQKDVQSLRDESKEIKEQLEHIRESLRLQEIQNAKVSGYQLGTSDKTKQKQ